MGITKINTNPFATTNLSQKDLYSRLQEYYDNQDLYNSIQVKSYEQGQWVETIKPLKTCVNRSVEFYTSRLCQNDVTVTANSEQVAQAIEQFLKWSNFPSQKRVMVRGLALLGDMFVKVVSTRNKVYAENIEPKYVTSFQTDYRGYVTEIRIDIPMIQDYQNYTYTEYWTKEYMATWMHRGNDATPLDQLGDPTNYLWLQQLGIDFVPIVWIPFKKVAGKDRGESCVGHALNKIDEVNRVTTRLHQMLYRYNKPTFVVTANAVDKNNRPLPAPVIKGKTSSEENDLDILSKEIVYLPGMSNLNSLIPNINYDSALNVIKSMESELEKDLPELRFNSLSDSTASGKALRTILASSIDRANECKSNFVDGVKRLNEMALSIGSYMGLFAGIGTYENGDFEHSIDLGEIFPVDNDERATTLKTLTDAGVPLETAMKIAGFEEEVIVEAVASKATQDEKALGSFVNSFNSQ